MRHRNKQSTNPLGRSKSGREALMRSLSESLILHGKIKTTLAKAKVLRSVVEPLVTKARRGTLADRRRIMSVLYTDKAVNKLMNDIAPKYMNRAGGYTRIVKTGHRENDAAEVAYIEFV